MSVSHSTRTPALQSFAKADRPLFGPKFMQADGLRLTILTRSLVYGRGRNSRNGTGQARMGVPA